MKNNKFNNDYIAKYNKIISSPTPIIEVSRGPQVRIMDCPYIPFFPASSLCEWSEYRGYGLRNATAYLLVYDVTSDESFEVRQSLCSSVFKKNAFDTAVQFVR